MRTLTREELRRHASELVIALCLCGGGYYFFVKPVEAELTQTRQAIVEARHEAHEAEMHARNEPRSRMAIERGVRLAEEVDVKSRSARDEAAMFTTLSQTAAELGVLVDAIQPNRQNTRSASTADIGAAGENVPPPDDVVTSYTVELRGGYAEIVRMLAILEGQSAYSVVRRVQVQTIADPDRQIVRAVISLDRLAFDTSALKAMVAGAEEDAAEPTGVTP